MALELNAVTHRKILGRLRTGGAHGGESYFFGHDEKPIGTFPTSTDSALT
jgi:hypothetical protein